MFAFFTISLILSSLESQGAPTSSINKRQQLRCNELRRSVVDQTHADLNTTACRGVTNLYLCFTAQKFLPRVRGVLD